MSLRYEFVPSSDESRLDHVGTYKRRVPVSLQRMYENALDWEHLPYLHGSSFTGINCLDSGAWGWRANVTSLRGVNSLLELRLDRDCRRWITRNLTGPSQGAEIWTHVFVVEPRQLDLVIDFFVPDVAESSKSKVGEAYARAYETLYDEDVWMMSERQRILDLRVDGIHEEQQLSLDKPGLAQLPLKVTLGGRTFVVNRYADEWIVYPAVCPHQLGPLSGDISAQGEVTCPWHGYRFDVRSGACTNGHSCRFGTVPEVVETADELLLSLSPG